MSPVQANTRMSDRRGTRAMSLRIRLPPSEGRVEGSRDAEDLVDPPGAAIDGDDQQAPGDPARAGQGRDRREREAPRRVAVREAGELDRLPVAVEKEDPRPLAVGDEEMARRADRHRGDQGSPEHDGRCAPGNDFHDLANAPLPRRLCRPVAPHPQVTALARRHEPRPRDAYVARVEDTAREIEPHDHVLSAVGDVEVPRRIHRRALGLDEEWRSPRPRPAPRAPTGPPPPTPIHPPPPPPATAEGGVKLRPPAHLGPPA